MAERILIVDDEENIARSFASLLSDEGYTTDTAASVAEARQKCERGDFSLVLLDLNLPGGSGLEFLRELRVPLRPEVLVVSGQSEIATALEAIKLGAVDYLEKPVGPERLLAGVRAALMLAAAGRQQRLMTDELDDSSRMIGNTAVMKKLSTEIAQAAPTDVQVLITGENGTGKELVATRLFLESKRRDKPLVRVNCPGVPETLFESELFGHRKGAFTGAVKDYPGRFVLADGGTIFLDEIGDLPLPCQAKLLRVLETGEVETLGAVEKRQVDVRVICATNRNLAELIALDKFREDLFYRVSVFHIDVPPLADRRDDIPALIGAFLKRFDPSGSTRLAPDAMAHLAGLDFPGNVRQLKNIVERLTIVFAGRTVEIADLSAQASSAPSPDRANALSLADYLRLFEKRVISQALSECDGNITQTAERLRVDRANLSRKIKQYGL